MASRVGRFSINNLTIKCNPDEALAVLRDCIVVRAEMMHFADRVEYIAYCDLFEAVSAGDEIPTYLPELTKGEDGTILVTKWVRQDG